MVDLVCLFCFIERFSLVHKFVYIIVINMSFILNHLSWYQSLFKIHWATCYQVSAIGPPTSYVHEPGSIVLVVRGCVKCPTSDRRWPDNVFISEGNPHLKSRFCGVVLGPITISKLVLDGSVLALFSILGFHHWSLAGDTRSTFVIRALRSAISSNRAAVLFLMRRQQ